MWEPLKVKALSLLHQEWQWSSCVFLCLFVYQTERVVALHCVASSIFSIWFFLYTSCVWPPGGAKPLLIKTLLKCELFFWKRHVLFQVFFRWCRSGSVLCRLLLTGESNSFYTLIDSSHSWHNDFACLAGKVEKIHYFCMNVRDDMWASLSVAMSA